MNRGVVKVTRNRVKNVFTSEQKRDVEKQRRTRLRKRVRRGKKGGKVEETTGNKYKTL